MAFASKDQLSQSLTTYLTKWLEVATKGNVVLSGHMIGAMQSMTIFKCKYCGQNWHVGDHLFKGPNVANPGQEFIPTELQDWVKEHRHVCKKFNMQSFSNLINCATCNWPYGAHDESWLKKEQLESQAQQMQHKADNQLTGEFSTDFLKSYYGKQGVTYKISYGVSPAPEPVRSPEPEKPKPIPPLPEPRGRKFR